MNNQQKRYIMSSNNIKNKKILKMNENLFLFFKLETIGFPMRNGSRYYKYSRLDKYEAARIIKISWGLYDFKKRNKGFKTFVIKPDGFTINNFQYHGITQQNAINDGCDINDAFEELKKDLQNVKFIVGHNLDFSINILYSELFRANREEIIQILSTKEHICTADKTSDILKIPLKTEYSSSNYKTPKFSELYVHCFKKNYINNFSHEDFIKSLSDCFFHIIKNNRN